MLKILKTLITKIGLNDARLPYNVNWMIKNTEVIQDFLNKFPLIVVDIGARGGSLEELENLKNFISYYAFDADAQEAERLNQAPPKGFNDFKVFPFYIGEINGWLDFNIFIDPGHSSLFIPNERFKNLFTRNQFGISKTVKVESRTLDTILVEQQLDYPDIIKIDTQGTELGILNKSEKALSQASLVEVEVEFIEMYQNQPLIHDVMKYMYERGFELLYLNRVFGSRTAYPGISRGQLIFGDALFGRREDSMNELKIEKIAKYIILLINYGHVDYAYYLFNTRREVQNIIPDIKFLFKKKKTNIIRFVQLQIDKLLYLALHLRKTNNQLMDSDRSWPIR